jgi:ElaB/YqjD/DUF883 family membrane-anchored ribosome-binding protein
MRKESVETANSAADTIRDIGGQVRDAASDKYNEVRDAAAEKYNHVRDQASGYLEDGRRKAMEWEHSLESHVQEKPLQSVLIAAGIGLLLGLLWKRS